jgi:hypothetical protein
VAAPTLVATPGQGFVNLQLTTDARNYADIYRVVGSRETLIRSGVRAPLTAGDWVGSDYEVPLGVQVTYRADLFDAANGVAVEDVASAPMVQPPLATGRIYLHNVSNPGAILSPQVEEMDAMSRESKATVYDVVGRSAPVVVSATRSSRTGSLQLLTRTLEERDALWALFEATDVLLLRSSPEYGIGNIYLVAQNVSEERVTRLGYYPHRRFTVEWVETGSPVGSALTAANNSWQVVTTGASTWEVLMGIRDNWSEVYVQPIGSAEEGDYRGDVPDL